MYRKAALAAALVIFAALMTGCALDEGTETNSGKTGVDIVVPYATTTPLPETTEAPEALYIDSDGNVVLNDESVLGDISEDDRSVASEYSQLRLGSTGEAVSKMQQRLTELGYFTAGVSGVFDEETEDAVKLFERGYGTMQTGIATAAMQERLYSADAKVYNSDAYVEAVESSYERLELNDTGSAVIALQSRLKELGYPIFEVTGVYDKQTAEAVGLFYEAYGYRARNYAIVDMQKVLFSEDAKRYAGEQDELSEADAAAQALALNVGDSGTRVSQLQLRLRELGYLEEATGNYDQTTAEAVAAFQQACRETATGVADVGTQQQLFAPDAPRMGELKQIYALIQWGDSGEAVKKLQERLIELGFYTGEADGIYSDAMAAAVKQFQKASGTAETGVATIELQELAFSEYAPLSAEKAAIAQEEAAAAQIIVNGAIKGDDSEDVRAMQERLIELGYLNGTADGKFGSGTEAAVMQLQEAMGLQPTGEVTSDLMNLIHSSAAPEKGRKYWKYPQENRPLKTGDTGDEVVELQKRLWELGYLDKDDISNSVGVYEEFTAAAVNAVMKDLGCRRRDGRASAEFLTVLYSKAADALEK